MYAVGVSCRDELRGILRVGACRARGCPAAVRRWRERPESGARWPLDGVHVGRAVRAVVQIDLLPAGRFDREPLRPAIDDQLSEIRYNFAFTYLARIILAAV